jgi:hypothetical protein
VRAPQPVVYEIPEGTAVELQLPARVRTAADKDTPAAVAEAEWVAHVLEQQANSSTLGRESEPANAE